MGRSGSSQIFLAQSEKVQELKGDVRVHPLDPDGLQDLGKHSAQKC